jgi:hypothetical protein
MAAGKLRTGLARNSWSRLMFAVNEYEDTGTGFVLYKQHGVFADRYIAEQFLRQKIERGFFEEHGGLYYDVDRPDYYIDIIPVTHTVWI